MLGTKKRAVVGVIHTTLLSGLSLLTRASCAHHVVIEATAGNRSKSAVSSRAEKIKWNRMFLLHGTAEGSKCASCFAFATHVKLYFLAWAVARNK